jgi:hypothetical protein
VGRLHDGQEADDEALIQILGPRGAAVVIREQSGGKCLQLPLEAGRKISV